MIVLVATLGSFCLAGLVGWLERGFLVSLRSRSLVQRGWVILPGTTLAVFAFGLTVAAVGAIGIPLAIAAAILAFEMWAGLTWYHWWANRLWLGVHRRMLDAHPELEQRLGRSKFGRFLAKRRD
jgi:hypothetical protein